MTSFDTSRTTYGTATAVYSIVSFVANGIGTIVAWNDARLTRNALISLSSRQLQDIGLVRGDIDNIAIWRAR